MSFIFVVQRPFPSKMVVSSQNYFSRLFWEILFFSEKIDKWKIFKTSFPTKNVTLIFVTRRALPLKEVISPPRNGFSQFFQKILFFQKNCFIIKHLVSKSDKKSYIHFSRKSPLSLKNGQMRPQNSFSQFPQKILLFQKKFLTWKYLASNW